MSKPIYPTDPDDLAFARAGSPNSNPACGLTKREYFAACALTGLLTDASCPVNQRMAFECVHAADYLIDALNDEVPE